MSHIVRIQCEVRDREAVSRACRRLELPEPFEGEAKVFTTLKKGLLVQLKDWEFPIVCDLASGQGRVRQLRRTIGAIASASTSSFRLYAVEKATLEARKRGHSVVEQPLADGSIKLTIGVAGEAR